VDDEAHTISASLLLVFKIVENQAGGWARVNPGRFEQNHLPRPENAAPAAALMPFAPAVMASAPTAAQAGYQTVVDFVARFSPGLIAGRHTASVGLFVSPGSRSGC
jgi:hypothetical protein